MKVKRTTSTYIYIIAAYVWGYIWGVCSEKTANKYKRI